MRLTRTESGQRINQWNCNGSLSPRSALRHVPQLENLTAERRKGKNVQWFPSARPPWLPVQCDLTFHGRDCIAKACQATHYSRALPGHGRPRTWALPAASGAIFVVAPSAAERWIISGRFTMAAKLLAFTCSFDNICFPKLMFASKNWVITCALYAGNIKPVLHRLTFALIMQAALLFASSLACYRCAVMVPSRPLRPQDLGLGRGRRRGTFSKR